MRLAAELCKAWKCYPPGNVEVLAANSVQSHFFGVAGLIGDGAARWVLGFVEWFDLIVGGRDVSYGSESG